MDLSFDTGTRLWAMKYELNYLNDWRNNRDKFLKSKQFLDLDLELLLDHHNELLSLIADLRFHEPRPDINKERLDNPLKILDFIKDIHNPLYSHKFDFIKFENRFFDSDAFAEARRGFKPVFNFYKPKPEIKITFK